MKTSFLDSLRYLKAFSIPADNLSLWCVINISNVSLTCLHWNCKIFLTSISTRSRSELWHSCLKKASKARWPTTTEAATTAATATSSKATATSAASFGFCWKKSPSCYAEKWGWSCKVFSFITATRVSGENRTSFQNTLTRLCSGWIVTATTTAIVPQKRWSNRRSYWVLLSHHFPFGCSGLESRETVTLENLELQNGWNLWEYHVVFVNVCVVAFQFFIPLLSYPSPSFLHKPRTANEENEEWGWKTEVFFPLGAPLVNAWKRFYFWWLICTPRNAVRWSLAAILFQCRGTMLSVSISSPDFL